MIIATKRFNAYIDPSRVYLLNKVLLYILALLRRVFYSLRLSSSPAFVNDLESKIPNETPKRLNKNISRIFLFMSEKMETENGNSPSGNLYTLLRNRSILASCKIRTRLREPIRILLLISDQFAYIINDLNVY